MNEEQRRLLRQIPAIHDMLRQPQVLELQRQLNIDTAYMTAICQETADEVRELILRDGQTDAELTDDRQVAPFMIDRLTGKLNQLAHSALKPLINGTGVILHTNLGRAKLSRRAQEALQQVASHYSSLEFNLTSGMRGSRHDIVERLICRLTGAEAALVCNNNAAAVFLALKELATDKEVLISRGELVEIGGSFRVFEIMKESGAVIREVGTTNKTHLYDYERAVTERTGLILKVHTSNFVIRGFTHSVPAAELMSLARKHDIPVFEDLGSGVLLDLKSYGIGHEPTVQEVLREGIDLVSFSGDKLLGGPQAGILAGRNKWIQRLKKHQLMRAMRVDKFTLAALHATLSAYLDPQAAIREIPTLNMILASPDHIRSKAEHFMNKVDRQTYACQLVQIESEVGGGTMPEVKLPSWGVQISSAADRSTAAFSHRLRTAEYPVIGRIHQDELLLDFRTIIEEEIELVLAALHDHGS